MRRIWHHLPNHIILLISIGLNVFLYQFALSQYEELHRVRLDPTSERHFSRQNSRLTRTPKTGPRIVFFGDSRIADWQRLPHIPDVEFINRGRAGDTTAQLRLRIERDVIALDPDIVVLQAGVNDLTAIGVFPLREREIIDTCRENLDWLTKRMQGAGIAVVAMTILPAGDISPVRAPVWSEKTRNAIEELNAGLRSGETASGARIVDCDPAIATERRTRREYQLDALHMNPSGYVALDGLLMPALKDLLRSQSGSN